MSFNYVTVSAVNCSGPSGDVSFSCLLTVGWMVSRLKCHCWALLTCSYTVNILKQLEAVIYGHAAGWPFLHAAVQTAPSDFDLHQPPNFPKLIHLHPPELFFSPLVIGRFGLEAVGWLACVFVVEHKTKIILLLLFWSSAQEEGYQSIITSGRNLPANNMIHSYIKKKNRINTKHTHIKLPHKTLSAKQRHWPLCIR